MVKKIWFLLEKKTELYANYQKEIESRKKLNLHPKPIDDGNLVKELILNIKNNDFCE